ncbi:MAG: rhomboid family intramembrane serine protease [Candidatus Xenobia bacterium]
MEEGKPFDTEAFLRLLTRQTPACRVLLLALTLGWALTAFAGVWIPSDQPWLLAAKDNVAIWQGEGWRLLTALWVHAGLLHLLMVLLVLAFFGPMLEALVGTGRFIAIWTVAGLTGMLASLAFSPDPQVGASPAVMGVLGALGIALSMGAWDLDGTFRLQMAIGVLATVFLLGATPMASDVVDGAAHVGGLMAGALSLIVLSPAAGPAAARLRAVLLLAIWLFWMTLVGLQPRGPELEVADRQQALQAFREQRIHAGYQKVVAACSEVPEDPTDEELQEHQAELCCVAAQAAYDDGDMAATDRWLHQALQLDGTQQDALEMMVTLDLERGDAERAALQLRPAERLHPLDAHLRVYEARAAMLRHDWDGARTILRNAIPLSDDDAGPWQALGELELATNHLDAAREAYDAALKRDGSEPGAWIGEARVDLAEGHVDAARQRYDAAIAACPSTPALYLEKASLESGNGQLDLALHDLLMARATSLQAWYDSDCWDPQQTGPILQALGDFATARGDTVQARAWYEQVTALPLRNLDDSRVQAAAFIALGRPDEAEPFVTEGLKRCPQDDDLLALQARLAELRGEVGQARQILSGLVSGSQAYAWDAWFDYGMDAWRQGDRPKAVGAFSGALRLTALEDQHRLCQAWLAVAEGRLSGAATDLPRLMAWKPGSPEVLTLAAVVAGDDHARAIGLYKRALLAAPGDPWLRAQAQP